MFTRQAAAAARVQNKKKRSRAVVRRPRSCIHDPKPEPDENCTTVYK